MCVNARLADRSGRFALLHTIDPHLIVQVLYVQRLRWREGRVGCHFFVVLSVRPAGSSPKRVRSESKVKSENRMIDEMMEDWNGIGTQRD